MKQQGFPKSEHLKSKKLIEALFKGAHTCKGYPILLVYLTSNEIQTHQAGFSVSKKKFKRAVDRNLLKRRMREAYRLQKHLLPATADVHVACMFIYMPKEILDFSTIQKGVKKSLALCAQNTYAHKP